MKLISVVSTHANRALLIIKTINVSHATQILWIKIIRNGQVGYLIKIPNRVIVK